MWPNNGSAMTHRRPFPRFPHSALLPPPPPPHLPPSPSISLSHTLATDCLSQQQQQLTSIQLCSHIGVCTIMLYGWRGEVVWIPLKRQSPDRRIRCFSIYLFVCLSVYLLCSIPVDWAYGAASVRFSFKLDMLWYLWGIVQELCESRGGRPWLSVLTSLLVSVDVKNYWTLLRHWSQLVPNMSTDIWGHSASIHHHTSGKSPAEIAEIKSREVELGSHSWMDCFAAELLNSCFWDTVFVTLLRRTAVETAVSGVQKLLPNGGVPTSLTLLFWRWLTVSSVFAGRRAGTSYSEVPPPPSPFACP